MTTETTTAAETVLRLILGDQLNLQHSWFQSTNKQVTYCMFEMRQETDYTTHHIQKIIAFFASMRHFAQTLKDNGHQVIYYQIDDPKNTQNLTQNLFNLINNKDFQRFDYQLPDEHRLDQQLQSFCRGLSIPFTAFDTEHFLTQRTDLATFFKGKKTFLMESFYRKMRRKHDLLMDGDHPISGQWNYDKENRKKIPKDHVPPTPWIKEKDYSEIYAQIKKADIKTIGRVDPKAFIWPTSREESLQVLEFFIQEQLQYFGTFQDAMTPNYWLMYHSRLSFAMNAKLLTPLEVVQKAIGHWKANQETIELSQIEGFVRQIIGWREYMRGIYWAKMPEFAELNFLNHKNKLPKWFWTGDTKMKCLSHSIGQSLDYAYAHHIQRLMIIGNFALLAGIDPDELDQWYLGIYIDAIEWVEITNTRGMSQFADGGIVGTKPYVSSANYINKMSHYCKNCYYDPKQKTGPKACPFNSLYWHFYDRHRDKLAKNPRIGMAYRTLDKMDNEQLANLLEHGQEVIANLNDL